MLPTQIGYGRKRNATITMVSDGILMKVSKEDFNALLKEPMLSWVGWDEAAERVMRFWRVRAEAGAPEKPKPKGIHALADRVAAKR